MARHVVAKAGELAPGGSLVVELEGRSVGVFNVDGRLHALRNVCPHHGAPLCLGPVTGRMAPSAPHEYVYDPAPVVLRCPWHGFEFGLADGRSLVRPDEMRVRVYRVEVEAGEVAVYL